MRFAALAAALLLTACRQLPDLPAVELRDAQPSVRAVIEPALAAAHAQPGDAAAVARLGMALHAHNQLAAAAQAYARAAAIEPGNADYAYYHGLTLAGAGRYADAVAPLTASLKLRESVPARLLLADSLYSAGQSAPARREYEAVITASPGTAAAHYGLGRCLQGDEAVSSLRRAIELFPRYGAARFALAAAYRQLGRRAEAEAALENYERDKLVAPPLPDPAMDAVRALDSSPGGLIRAAQALEREGRFAEAAPLLERAEAWPNLISVYARLEEPQKAETAYRKAIAREPKNAEAHYNFGVFSLRLDRLADARKAFEDAIAADPSHAEALDNLGAIIEQTGALDRAAALFRRAIAAKPALRLAHFHLGRILANQRRYPEAIQSFEKTLSPVDEQTPGFLYALGAVHARAGARPKAIEILQRAQAEAARYNQADLAASIARDLNTLNRR